MNPKKAGLLAFRFSLSLRLFKFTMLLDKFENTEFVKNDSRQELDWNITNFDPENF